ncbi:serine/threonine-protein kinase Nek11-like isoform X2 [Apostichopus japonicus]
MHEAKLLSKLHHPNIVKFYDSFLDGEFFCIITEYCEGGDLDDMITATKKAGKSLDQSLIMDWFVQLTLAVQHMHSRRVLHRDLKTRNIFLKNNMVKIGDFGISRVLMGTTDMASTFTGTPYYMSPEVLKHEGYNSKSDVWSIACILYELCALQHAFEGQSLMGVMYKIVEGKPPEIPKNYDKNVQKVIEMLLNRNPSERPSAAEVTKIPYVGRHIEKMYNRMADLKYQKEDDVKLATQEAEELATLVREKTHLEDLQDISVKERPPDPQEVAIEKMKHLTPRERMRLRKIQQADEQAHLLSMHARKNRFENEVRKGTIQGTMGTFTRPAWQVGAGEAQQIQHSSYAYSDATTYPPMGYADQYAEYDEDPTADRWAAEGMTTVQEASRTMSPSYVSYEDRPIKPASQENTLVPDGTLKAPSGGSYDDRPITPMKHTVNFDDPDIASATPPGLAGRQKKSPKKNGASKKTQSPSKERNSEKAVEPDGEEENGDFEPPEGIPEDADAAETFYSQHEDFESDSEPDDDYGALMDCMQDALSKTATEHNATITDTVHGCFSPTVRDLKIKNLRAECEKKMGKESFKKAYAFLKEARFGETTMAGETADEKHIIQGLRQFVDNPSDGFLIDQLLFLEEQAKFMK